jgi:hypothetical protein
MKRYFLPLLAIFIATATDASEPPSRVSTPANSPALNVNALPEDAQVVLKSLKAGMTRQEVVRHFEADGGLIFPSGERFYLRGVSIPGQPNLVVMVEISFQPSAMDEATFADADRRREWYRHHDKWGFSGSPKDTVRSVGSPYASGIHID